MTVPTLLGGGQSASGGVTVSNGSTQQGTSNGSNSSDAGNSAERENSKLSCVPYYSLTSCLQCTVKDAEIKTLRQRIQVMSQAMKQTTYAAPPTSSMKV